MAVDKQQVLYNAQNALNRPDQPWYVTVEGDSIVARWNWMDATWFAPEQVTEEVKDYTFEVTLKDNGKFKELDTLAEKATGISASSDGKVGFGFSSSTFKGKATQKSFSFGIGADNKEDKVGLIGYKLDTDAVKKPVRAYLESCGWKKAGLFG